MANIVKTYTFVNGQPADATQVNKNFDDIIAGVGDISAAGHELINDANAAAQLATLGTAAYSEGTWTPTLIGFTVVGAAPAVFGTYRRIGNLVFVICRILAGSGGNTSVAVVVGISRISGLPVNVLDSAICMATTNALPSENFGVGLAGAGASTLFLPAIAAQAVEIVVSATYNA